MSATFNEDVQALKELVLHNPVRLVEGASGTGARDTQRLIVSSQRKLFVFGVGLLLLDISFLVLSH